MSKKAIGYIRISTKEQSNYSLSGQREQIGSYCEKNDIKLLDVFEDDGQSAKNFDRISWHELENYIAINHKAIDYLIVYKYDRFSRNLSEALPMIEKLEKKYKIIILSILENIGVHPKSPMFFLFRTQLLLNANNELNYIRERTAFGMHQGAKAGKFLHAAPFGYVNAKDSGKNKTIAQDPVKAELVRQVFKMYLNGVSMEDIRRSLKGDGLTVTGNSAMRRLLSNPAYAGMVKVPSYYDEPEKMIDGQHEAIIDKGTWWAVQGKLSGKQHNKHDNEVVPLRGSLHCECGRLLTAGNSKGKTKYYWYYVCNVCKENLSATKLHAQFDNLLGELTLEPYQLEFLQEQVVKIIQRNLDANQDAIDRKNRELSSLENKIDAVQEKYFEGKLDDEAYKKWKSRYESERMFLQHDIQELEEPISETWQRYESSLTKLSDIAYIYHSGSMNNKKSFINVVFDNKLSYEAGIYRTLYLTPLYRSKALILKEKGLLIYEQSLQKTSESEKVRQEGVVSNLLGLLKWVSEVKVA